MDTCEFPFWSSSPSGAPLLHPLLTDDLWEVPCYEGHPRRQTCHRDCCVPVPPHGDIFFFFFSLISRESPCTHWNTSRWDKVTEYKCKISGPIESVWLFTCQYFLFALLAWSGRDEWFGRAQWSERTYQRVFSSVDSGVFLTSLSP